MAEYDAEALRAAIAAYDAASARYAAVFLAHRARRATANNVADADYFLRQAAQRLRLRLEGLPEQIAAWQRVVGAARAVSRLWDEDVDDAGPALERLIAALAALDGEEGRA